MNENKGRAAHSCRLQFCFVSEVRVLQRQLDKTAAGFGITVSQRSCTYLLSRHKHNLSILRCYLMGLIYDIRIGNISTSDSCDLYSATRAGLSVWKTSHIFRHHKRYHHLTIVETYRDAFGCWFVSVSLSLTCFFPGSGVLWLT